MTTRLASYTWPAGPLLYVWRRECTYGKEKSQAEINLHRPIRQKSEIIPLFGTADSAFTLWTQFHCMRY
jgi:hypothetical protein